MRWLLAWASREAPTDVVALLRVGVALLLWARFGSECAAYAGRTPVEWLLTALFFPLTTAMLVGLWSRVSTAATAALLMAMWLYYAPELGKDFDHHTRRERALPGRPRRQRAAPPAPARPSGPSPFARTRRLPSHDDDPSNFPMPPITSERLRPGPIGRHGLRDRRSNAERKLGAGAGAVGMRRQG
jgi:hypothetical protein